MRPKNINVERVISGIQNVEQGRCTSNRTSITYFADLAPWAYNLTTQEKITITRRTGWVWDKQKTDIKFYKQEV